MEEELQQARSLLLPDETSINRIYDGPSTSARLAFPANAQYATSVQCITLTLFERLIKNFYSSAIS